MNRLDRWLSFGLVVTLGFLLGTLGFFLWDKMPSTVEHVAWSSEAQWIAPSQPSYSFYARRTFYLPDTVQTGWLRLSADNDFILYVNGQVVAQEVSTPRNTKGLASELSESFQHFNDDVPYSLLVPDWIQISNPRDWRLTSYIDLTRYLQPGKNAIGLKVQKSQQNPRVIIEGAVNTVSDSSPINLTTGATSWRVSTLSENRQGIRWFDLDFPDESWPEAKAIGSLQQATYSRLSQHLFDKPLQGTWITGSESPQGEVWLRGLWQVPQARPRAFMRFAGKGEYALLINGLLVNRYGIDDGSQLHMYEVTNFLRTGFNSLAVRLAHPLNQDKSSGQSSLDFFLDGWVETNQGDIVSTITTDSTWSFLTKTITDWTEGSGQGQPVNLGRLPEPQEFQRTFEGNAYLLNYPDYLWHQNLWQLGGIVFALVYTWSLGWFWLGRQDRGWDSFGTGAALLLPGTLFLIGITLLKHRYAQAERGLLFAHSHSNALILLGFVGIVLLTLLWSKMRQKVGILPRWGLWFLLGLVACVGLSWVAGGNVLLTALILAGTVALAVFWRQKHWQLADAYRTLQQAWPAWGHWLLLVLIVGIGFGLRAYNLGFVDLDSDENTSLDATRGILRTGAPIAVSGIWYTRGPFYHYLLALWLRLVGDSAVNARFLSVIFGTATLVLVYIFTRQVTKKIWIALVVVAILTIDPWQIWYSRNIRFYQISQFLTILSFWSFFQGFTGQNRRIYQYIFFISLTLNLLTQEVTLMLLPGFLLLFLYFYRKFKLSLELPLIISSVMTLTVFTYNIYFVKIKSLTPLAGLSSLTTSFIKFHLNDITVVITNFFVGFNQMHTIYTFFFLWGCLYSLKQRDLKIISLFSAIFIYLAFVTMMVFLVATRYAYPIYPLFILISIYGAFCFTESLGHRLEYILINLLPLRRIAIGLVVLLLLANIEPGRILSSYSDAITPRHTQVSEYIRNHRQAGDVVISNVPAVHANTLGGTNYFLVHRMSFFDAVYWNDGRLIDRWEGGIVITNLDQINQVLEKSNRVWFHLLERQSSKDAELAKFYNYLQTIGKPVLDTFGAKLRLWRREDGLLPRVPNRGRDLGAY